MGDGWWRFPSFLMCLVLCVCLCVRVCLSQDPSVCVTMGTACFLYFSLLTPPPTHTHTPPPLFFPPSFTHRFQCYHGDTCLSPLCLLPVSHAALSHQVSLSVCLFAVGSLCALGLPFFVYSLFVCVFCVLRICMIVCLAVFLRTSLSVFALCLTLFFSVSLWLTVWPPGFLHL